MASEFLSALGIKSDDIGSVFAQKFFEGYLQAGESKAIFSPLASTDVSKEELTFIVNNYKFFNQLERAYIWNIPAATTLGFNYTNADIGIFNYYKDLKDIDDEVSRRGFLLFAGMYLRETKNQSDLWSTVRDRNREIIIKVFFHYERNKSIFDGVRASIADYSFVNFKKDLSVLINDWLNTNPKIYGLDYFTFGESIGLKTASPLETRWNSTGELVKLSFSEKKSLVDLGLTAEATFSDPDAPNSLRQKFGAAVNYKTPIAGNDELINNILLNENLEATEAVQLSNDINYLQVAYFKIAQPLIEEHSFAAGFGDFRDLDALKLENLRVNYNDTLNFYVNKNNRPVGNIAGDVGQIGYRIAQEILNSFLEKFAAQILEFLKKGLFIVDPNRQEVKDAFKKAEALAGGDEALVGNEIPLEELSEEDIAAKQRFLKQCLLMSRLKELAESHITEINEEDGVHIKMPYRGRLYLIDENLQDEQSSMNKLLIPNSKSINRFMNITTEEHSNLIPKLRFYKVFTDKKGALQQTEFTFPKYENSQRINNLSSPGVFDRGSSFGVKDFSFSFEGSTPATSRNDIKATLSLYFQSFEDFIKPRPENGGMSYVELLILPGGKKRGSAITSPLQFDPSYYRIKVDVGWELDSAPNPGIRQSLQKINKSFYLNMIDHDMNIRDDGSVEINVTYRAYMESALKGSTLNALSSRETKKKLEELQKEYNEILATKACTMKQLNQIRAQFLQIEDNLRKANFQSIIRRLLDAGFINNVKVEASSALSFQRTGFLTEKARFEQEQDIQDQILEKSQETDLNFINTDRVIDQKNSDNQLHINYFYLGDLIYVILDTLYQEENLNLNEKYILGSENFKFVLSSFQYLDYFNNNQPTSINMAHIPISVEIFNEWFTENVIKPERTSYPIMYFIRDFTNFLVTEILLENCFKNDLEKTFQFKTSNFLASKSSSSSSTDPLGQLLLDSNTKFLNLDKEYKTGRLPLSSDTNSHIKDMYNYIVIYADNPRTNTDKSGKKLEDETNGIYHYQIGRPRGILKKIKFSKSDMQYIREARFFRHGHDGLLQLSAVYKVTMEMVGNTLYYPGMELFIDPRGLLGAGSEFDPTQGSLNGEASIANKLGFGGYHIVTRVNSSVGPGKFSTTVDALFSYSGDGDPMSRVLGSKDLAKEQKISAIDRAFVNERPTKDQKDYCDAEIDRLYRISAGTAYGVDTSNISRPPLPTAESEEARTVIPEQPPEEFFDPFNFDSNNDGIPDSLQPPEE